MNVNYRKPNLFIVGAAKAGTTSLWSLLRQHPSIYMPQDKLYKEPAYFSNLKGIKTEKKYLNLFSRATNEKYIGEASTAYLTDPASARRIYEFNPNASIIIMLRNPIQRAYSLFNWMVQEGYEYALTFEGALQLEEKRKFKEIPNLFLETEYYFNYMYFSSGLYSEQIERYMSLFERKNIFIGIFENFISQPSIFMIELLDWLNLDHNQLLNLDIYNKNTSYQVRHPHLSFLLRKFIQATYFFEFNSKDKRDWLLRKVSLTNLITQPMKISTYEKLYDLYQPEFDKLEQQLDLDISLWKNPT